MNAKCIYLSLPVHDQQNDLLFIVFLLCVITVYLYSKHVIKPEKVWNIFGMVFVNVVNSFPTKNRYDKFISVFQSVQLHDSNKYSRL